MRDKVLKQRASDSEITKWARSLLGDTDPTVERQKLVEFWKRHHPEAVKERSAYLHPLVCRYKDTPPKIDPPVKTPEEEWSNDVYNVSVRRWQKDPVFGTSGGMIQLGISALDGTARHDWREFQAIKNQIAGPECEAFELYPADSRLIDPSNYFSLWCFPSMKRIRVGHGPELRNVEDQEWAHSPQRKLPPEKP